jgi:hypothetical protein
MGTTGWRLIAAAVVALFATAGTAAWRLGVPDILWVSLFVLVAAAALAVVVLTVREQTQPRREQEHRIRALLLRHFVARARGVARAGERGDYFSGRTVAREELVRWLTQPGVGGWIVRRHRRSRFGQVGGDRSVGRTLRFGAATRVRSGA